jgi:L-threonylcarbamoyladenylate synthase
MITNNIQDIASDLSENKVVAIPTDTVFGLASIYNSFGEENLRIIKNRDTKPFTVLFSSVSSVTNHIELTDNEKKFMIKFLPGSLTIIFKRLNIGIRVIDTDFLKSLFGIIDFPLYLTSANLANSPVLKTSKEINDVFPSILTYESPILDNLPSSIVAIDEQNITLIRQGAIKFDILKEYFESL